MKISLYDIYREREGENDDTIVNSNRWEGGERD